MLRGAFLGFGHVAELGEVLQDLKLQRRIARCMATVRKDLHRYLALDRLQHLGEAVSGFADRGSAGHQAFERAQSRGTSDLP